jgi:hypothetical protein
MGHGFSDGARVGSIVLLPEHETFHPPRRNQFHFMAKLRDLAGPVMGGPAGLEPDLARRFLREER